MPPDPFQQGNCVINLRSEITPSIKVHDTGEKSECGPKSDCWKIAIFIRHFQEPVLLLWFR